MFAAAGTTLVLSQRVKFVLIAGFLALSLLVGVSATATHVGAQPVDRGLDGFSNACADLQDQASALVAQYSSVGRANPYDPQLDDILAQLRSLGTTWQQIGCQGVYGNIVGFHLITSKTGVHPVDTGGFTVQGTLPQTGARPVNTGGSNIAG
jgi:hypothetical protein